MCHCLNYLLFHSLFHLHPLPILLILDPLCLPPVLFKLEHYLNRAHWERKAGSTHHVPTAGKQEQNDEVSTVQFNI